MRRQMQLVAQRAGRTIERKSIHAAQSKTDIHILIVRRDVYLGRITRGQQDCSLTALRQCSRGGVDLKNQHLVRTGRDQEQPTPTGIHRHPGRIQALYDSRTIVAKCQSAVGANRVHKDRTSGGEIEESSLWRGGHRAWRSSKVVIRARQCGECGRWNWKTCNRSQSCIRHIRIGTIATAPSAATVRLLANRNEKSAASRRSYQNNCSQKRTSHPCVLDIYD